MQSCLENSPPAKSNNVAPITNPPPPWDPAFGLISTDRNPAFREKWFATSTSRIKDIVEQPRLTLASFPGANSFHQVYWRFVRHLHKLLGWWMGDLPSYGMIIRIVFDPIYQTSQVGAQVNPAFICEKVQLVNRLHGMGASTVRSSWMEVNCFELKSLHGSPGSDGTTAETDRLSIDVSVPGVRTEKLWVSTWNECRTLDPQKLALGTDLARIAWQGSQESSKAMIGQSTSPSEPSILSRNGQPSIVSRARALATQMVFGHTLREGAQDEQQEYYHDDEEMDLDEDDELPEVGPGIFGQGLTISQIVAVSAVDTFENGDFDHIPHHLRSIQQRSGGQIHTVFLSSGAILTTPASDPFATRNHEEKGKEQRLSLRCEKYQPYQNLEHSRSRAFGLNLSDYLPLPPIDFPPPALLPLVKDLDSDFACSSTLPQVNSSCAFERFLDHGTDFELNVLRMEPCPPYRPWPHLSQPQSSGLRFVPIKSPPGYQSSLEASRTSSGEIIHYKHPRSILPQTDPGSSQFDWNTIQGLYGMTYGPWGLELIYIRSRLLTIHDFKPGKADWRQEDAFPRTTGPHGPGHTLKEATGALQKGMHWRPEPYVDLSDLQAHGEDLSFIRPGCRVIEGVKCSGDANVPRGTISFRAYSRGQDQDSCIAYYPPDSQFATFPPWDGRGITKRYSNIHSVQHQQQQNLHTPGRILDCATGRLAMEGFVNAGCWKRCSIKITSTDEIHVYWEALRKVAVIKRLTAC